MNALLKRLGAPGAFLYLILPLLSRLVADVVVSGLLAAPGLCFVPRAIMFSCCCMLLVVDVYDED